MVADILIVDDEHDIRELVAGILEDEGHGARLARDSDEAIAAIKDTSTMVTPPVKHVAEVGVEVRH